MLVYQRVSKLFVWETIFQTCPGLSVACATVVGLRDVSSKSGIWDSDFRLEVVFFGVPES